MSEAKSAQAASAGGGWGFGFVGGGNKNEVEELKENLSVLQEELECKLAENRKLFIFQIKHVSMQLVTSFVFRTGAREDFRSQKRHEQHAR